MNNKKILIVGGTRGLGKELVSLLSKNNQVFVAGSSCQKNHDFNQSPSFHYLDLVNTNSIISFFNLLKINNIKLDLVIFNASINLFNPLKEQNIEDIENILSINLKGCILINKFSLDHLQNDGIICNISSVLANIPLPCYSTYSATKAGIKAFSESLNREVIDTKQSVLFYQPRGINTKMNNKKMNEFNEIMNSKIDTPELVAQQIVAFIKKRKSGIFNFNEKFFSLINFLFPSLIDKEVKKNIISIKSIFNKKEIA